MIWWKLKNQKSLVRKLTTAVLQDLPLNHLKKDSASLLEMHSVAHCFHLFQVLHQSQSELMVFNMNFQQFMVWQKMLLTLFLTSKDLLLNQVQPTMISWQFCTSERTRPAQWLLLTLKQMIKSKFLIQTSIFAQSKKMLSSNLTLWLQEEEVMFLIQKTKKDLMTLTILRLTPCIHLLKR